MNEGQRYLFFSYGQLHKSGVFRRIYELGPGAIVVEIHDVVVIGETGDVAVAQEKEQYEAGQSGPIHGSVLVPWHDISTILAQGNMATDEKLADERAKKER